MGLVLCLAACDKPEGAEAAKLTLKEAFDALERNDREAYLRHVDFGAEMDSVQMDCLMGLWHRHLEWRQTTKGALVSVDMIDAKMDGDSVCTVYFQYTFGDGTQEVGAQKMVRHGEEWKLRLRN